MLFHVVLKSFDCHSANFRKNFRKSYKHFWFLSQFVLFAIFFIWRANSFVTVYGLVGEEIAVGGKKMWLYLRAKTASFSIFCAAIASEKRPKN